MAEHAQDAPMAQVYAVKATDAWVFRAISRVENTLYVIGAPSRQRAFIYARELANQGYLVDTPTSRGSAPWAK